VVLFYTALHLVDAYMHACGEDHGKSHKERERIMIRLVDKRLLAEAMRVEYGRLEVLARAVRYEQPSIERDAFVSLLRDHFRPLEAALLPRLTGFETLPPLSVEESSPGR